MAPPKRMEQGTGSTGAVPLLSRWLRRLDRARERQERRQREAFKDIAVHPRQKLHCVTLHGRNVEVVLLALENKKWANAWARLLRREIARAVGEAPGADPLTG
ncbi:MAG: hypothetical protein IT373_16275 [Polyangiaceae bacterium]|nr:hypothetical protein [Polyangiaceae bacterium]